MSASAASFTKGDLVVGGVMLTQKIDRGALAVPHCSFVPS